MAFAAHGALTWSLTVIPGVAAEASPTLDLKEALRLAWRANPTLQISRLHALIAGEEVVWARSGFLPTMKSEVSQTSTLMARVRELATRLAAKPTLAVRCIIDCVWQAGYLTLEQGLDLEAKCYAICCTNRDVIHGLEAFMEKKRKR